MAKKKRDKGSPHKVLRDRVAQQAKTIETLMNEYPERLRRQRAMLAKVQGVVRAANELVDEYHAVLREQEEKNDAPVLGGPVLGGAIERAIVRLRGAMGRPAPAQYGTAGGDVVARADGPQSERATTAMKEMENDGEARE